MQRSQILRAFYSTSPPEATQISNTLFSPENVSVCNGKNINHLAIHRSRSWPAWRFSAIKSQELSKDLLDLPKNLGGTSKPQLSVPLNCTKGRIASVSTPYHPNRSRRELNDAHIVENYVFLITVRAKETIFRESARGIKGCITFKVENARSVTMDYMHQWLDYRSGPFYTPESVDRTLAHRKGLMRIYIHDVSGILPPPLDAYTLPTDISNWPPTYHKRYDPDWRRKFYESIGQRSPEYAFDWTDFEGGDEDELRALAKIPPARPSTPTDEGKDMYDVLILEAAHERAPSPASDSGNSSTEFTKHRDSRDRRSSTASDDFTPDTSRSVSPCGEAYIESLPSRSTSPVAY